MTSKQEIERIARGFDARALEIAESRSEGWHLWLWGLTHPFRFGVLYGKMTAYIAAARTLRAYLQEQGE